MKKIVSYTIPIDDQPHEIGNGRIIHARGLFLDEGSSESTDVQIFVEEDVHVNKKSQCVILKRTGDQYNWSGTAVCSFEIEYVAQYVRTREVMHVVRYG